MKEKKKEPISQPLKNMEIGDKLSFPIYRETVIKSTAGIVSRMLKRKYSTSIDTVNGIITITRTK